MVDVNDRLERYYLEKLWELIPPIHRDADGIADEGGGVLRGLVGVLAEQAAIERRSADRLWDDQFVDLSDDWPCRTSVTCWRPEWCRLSTLAAGGSTWPTPSTTDGAPARSPCSRV